MDITIVIPVYNAERLIERCLDSIFAQRFSGVFEVIAVNDASNDNSAAILEEYQSNYSNFRTIHLQENSSVSVARRTGVENAKGKYIFYIDVDDWINENALETLKRHIVLNEYPDAIMFNYQSTDGRKVFTSTSQVKETRQYSLKNKKEILNTFMGACWNKIFKRELLEDLLVYQGGYMNATEDLLICLEVFFRSEKICTIEDSLYNYYINEGSLTSKNSIKKYLKSQVKVYQILNQMVKKYQIKGENLMKIKFKMEHVLGINLVKAHLSFSKQIPFDKDPEIFNRDTQLFFGIDTYHNIYKTYQSRWYALVKIYKEGDIISTSKFIIKSLLNYV